MAKKKAKLTAPAAKAIGILPVILCAAVFFLLVCFSTVSTIKLTAMLLMLSFIVLVILRFDTLRQRITLPFLLLTAWVLMDAISVLYAGAGKFALREILKLLVAFVGCLYLISCDKGKGQQLGRTGSAVLAIAAAFAGLVSIDMLSTHLISAPFLSFLGLFSSDLASLVGVEAGVRMTSLFENPNVFAGTVGIGTLLSLGLANTEAEQKKRSVYLAALYINALSFVLAFSMGASGMIAAAFLLFLALEPKESRAQLLVLMIETLVLSLLSAMLISKTSFDVWDGLQVIPLLCAVAGAAALCGLERLFHEKASAIKPRTVVVLLGAVLAALVVFAAAAMNITGAVSLRAGEPLRRAAYPAAGEYTLQADSTGGLYVMIESQNRQDAMMHTESILYAGDAKEASFSVPDDSLVVYFNFTAAEDLTLSSVTYHGTESGSLPLDYKLLPGFIANRLQGLFANENAIQRTVFFSDGIKLFRQSPIFGLGIGSYENDLMSVQEFHYETKYAHNHYIQALSDTGIIGLCIFVGVLITSGIALWRTRKKHPLVPALAAALLFMAGHAAVEVVFSMYSYLPFAFGTFAVIFLCCGGAFPKVQPGKKLCSGIVLGITAFFAVWCVLLGGNMLARATVEREGTLESVTGAVRMDKFEWADYALSYVTSSLPYLDDPEYRAQADEYAARLEEVHSNSLHAPLAEYYFATGRANKGFAEVKKHISYRKSDPDMWSSIVRLLIFYDNGTAEYRSGIAEIAQLFEQWNAQNMGAITLLEEEKAYLSEAMP